MVAVLPPPDLPGLNSAWSRLVPVTGADGVQRSWHVLDSGAGPVGTLFCVHGNPTWSYLWRALVAEPPPGWRVIAIDQLGMGYSERTSTARSLQQRIDDLGDLTAALELTGPVVTVAHDWGGVISLGWALRHRDQLAGIVLTNTAVHQPSGSPAPALIRLARARGIRQLMCQWTPGFVRGTTALSWPRLSTGVRNAFAAPYGTAARRTAVADFVADIPLDSGHPSFEALQSVVAGLPGLADVPALLLWGPRDPVFSDLYLRDLIGRLPHASVHRFEGASHLVTEDRPEYVGVISDWLERGDKPDAVVGTGSVFNKITERRSDDAVAVLDASASISFAEFARALDDTAVALRRLGVKHGSRVALLVPPGIDLTVLSYACWRLGAITVLADAGLGLRGMGRALRGAGPDFVIGLEQGLLAARAMRLPGLFVSVAREVPLPVRLIVKAVAVTPPSLRIRSAPVRPADAPRHLRGRLGHPPEPSEEAAILFTSGATGPSKGVLYRHHQLVAQVELLRATYDITADDRLVAAFAPFSLYAPALGIAAAVPDMDVTAPATLTAAALADAITAIDATLVFAAPAALRNVVATAGSLTREQSDALARPRLLLSAGAPVPIGLQRAVAELLSNAEIHTPYGMTEALPVTDVSLTELAGLSGDGVCVGRPVPGVRVQISVLASNGSALAAPADVIDVTGEICVSAGHVKDRYDRLWATESLSSRDAGWHRTGDVGYLDADGRLWVQGRLRDVITTAAGPLTPVPVEQRIEALVDVRAAAVVGVGPTGAQQPVAVIVNGTGGRGLWLADVDLAEKVRHGAECDFAAIFIAQSLPVDIRHNSKIDRRALSVAATRKLSGRRSPRRTR